MARGALERSRGTVALVDHRRRRARRRHAGKARRHGVLRLGEGRRGAHRDAPIRRRPGKRAPAIGDPRARRGLAARSTEDNGAAWRPSARLPSPGCSTRATRVPSPPRSTTLPRRRRATPCAAPRFPEGADGAACRAISIPARVAARAYDELAAARGIVRRVVLLGPAHRVAVRGLAAPGVEAFDTPLGTVALDRAALRSLRGPAAGRDEATRRTRSSIRSKCSCRSCRQCWAISRWCRSPSAWRASRRSPRCSSACGAEPKR